MSACARSRSWTTPPSIYAKLDPRQYNGSAYGMTAAHRGYLRPVGEWNFEEVTIRLDHQGGAQRHRHSRDRPEQGDRIHGQEPASRQDATQGHFGFGGHNDPVAFRNVQIKELRKP